MRRPIFDPMTVVNIVRLLVFFSIVLFSLIVLGMSSHFAEILVPSELTRFVTVGLIVSVTTLVVTGSIFILGMFPTYAYAAQTRIELLWLGALSVLWMALAIFLSTAADVEIDCSNGTGSLEENVSVGMSSEEFDDEYRAIQACSFINAILLIGWFLLLLASGTAHYFSGHSQVWRTPVADYGWFDNPLGSKQRQKAGKTRGMGEDSSTPSPTEEKRGRSQGRDRGQLGRSVSDRRARSAVPVRPTYDQPCTMPERPRMQSRPTYELPKPYDLPKPLPARPQPLRATTQPIKPVAPPAIKTSPPTPTKPSPPSRQFPSPVVPSRPGPPRRSSTGPRTRQPTPPPITRTRVPSGPQDPGVRIATATSQTKPSLARAQTLSTSARPSAQPTRLNTLWQPPPGTRERLAAPPPVIGKDGLRSRSRSRDAPRS